MYMLGYVADFLYGNLFAARRNKEVTSWTEEAQIGAITAPIPSLTEREVAFKVEVGEDTYEIKVKKL